MNRVTMTLQNFFHYLLARPLSPYYFRKRVARGLACQACPLHSYGKSLVEEFLDVRLDDNRENSRRLDPSSVVLCDAGVLPGIPPLKLECSQGTGGFIQLPAWNLGLRKHIFVKLCLRGY